jgi:transcriptional regulator with XRE-family HTH domain
MMGSAPRREQRVNLETMIDRFMEREGLTLEAMARRSGLSLATIAALRSGARGKRPRQETVKKLAYAMGVDVRDVEAAVGGGGRRREDALLATFRALSDADKAQVEDLVARLATK